MQLEEADRLVVEQEKPTFVYYKNCGEVLAAGVIADYCRIFEGANIFFIFFWKVFKKACLSSLCELKHYRTGRQVPFFINV